MKRYPKSEDEFKQIIQQLEDGIIVGTPYNNLGLPIDENVYKVMVANIDTKRSAKNGFRFIYYLIKNESEIYLLSVYSKIDLENLRQSDIIKLIKKYCA
jgi:predicted P-loop ATPase/GTPase